MKSPNFSSYLLQQENFKANFASSFQTLRSSGDFLDVTLVCGEKSVDAHKVILSAFSPVFRNILKNNKQPHPYIYFKGILNEDIEAILDYLYTGETSVPASDVNRFIEAARDLQITGLMDSERDKVEEATNITTKDVGEYTFEEEVPRIAAIKEENEVSKNFTTSTDLNLLSDDSETSGTTGQGNESETEDMLMQRLLYEISLKMEKLDSDDGGNVWRCKECGKVSEKKLKLGMHVESHLEGFSLTCKICNKIYRTRNSLWKHKYVVHTKEQRKSK